MENKEHDNESVDSSSSDRASSDHLSSGLYDGLGQALLTNKIMLWAYAISLVIMAVGSVILLLGLAALMFFYPEKANAFLLLLGSPAVIILIHNLPHLRKNLFDSDKSTKPKP
jgi:hypothetical protein